MTRPSPTESATTFPVGTVRKGNDGAKWIVRATSSGVRRWQRMPMPVPMPSQTKQADKPNHNDMKACVEDFVRFEAKVDKNSFRIIQGWKACDRDAETSKMKKDCRVVRVADSYRPSRSDRIVTVPPEYRRKSVTAEFLKSVGFCRHLADPIEMKKIGALEWDKWMKQAKRQHGLTIADMLRFFQKEGKKSIRVLSLHRNTGDDTIDESINPSGRAVKPARFFRKCVATYTPKSSQYPLEGKLAFTDYSFDFELDVETPNAWYPLTDGALPARDPQNIFGSLFGKAVQWTELPKRTHVGYRGPMILLEAVDKMPPVYY